MAEPSVSMPFAFAALILLSLFCFQEISSTADPSSSFSFQSFSEDPNFDTNIALVGDAKVVNGGSWIQLTDSVSYSTGRVMWKKPFKLIEGKSGNAASFSTYFSFSMSKEDGDGLAFVMLPSSFDVSSVFGSNGSLGFDDEAVSVEYGTSKNEKYGDLGENHVAVVVGGFVSDKVSNLSSVNLLLNGGEKLHSWIDYEASSKRLEVRLSKSGDIMKPIDPLISYSIDLSKLWKDGEVIVGLSSSSGNSSQTCFLYSWSFILRHFPHWMHSYPVDPEAAKPLTELKREDMILHVLACFATTSVSTAFMFYAMLYVWTILRRRNQMMVVPEECALKTEDFEHKKVEVVLGKDNHEYVKN